jgi:hypothetical protein
LISSDSILEIRVLSCLPKILDSVLALQGNNPNLVSVNNLVTLIDSKMILVIKFVLSLGSLQNFLWIFYLALSNV